MISKLLAMIAGTKLVLMMTEHELVCSHEDVVLFASQKRHGQWEQHRKYETLFKYDDRLLEKVETYINEHLKFEEVASEKTEDERIPMLIAKVESLQMKLDSMEAQMEQEVKEKIQDTVTQEPQV